MDRPALQGGIRLRENPQLRTCLAFAVVALALLAVFREPILAGRIPYENDTVTYYYPTFRWAAEALRAGRFPLWAPWETTVYVGIAPLLLAGLAVVHVRNRLTWFFGAAGALSLYLALGDYPPLKLYYWLWQLPRFSVLRAPDRFALITVLAVAVMAAFGLARVLDARHPLPHGVGRGLVAIGAGFALLAAGMTALRAVAVANPDGATAAIRDLYLALPKGQAGERLVAGDVYRALLGALDLTRAENLEQFLLVTATLALLTVARRKPHAARLVGVLLVLVAAADLGAFAARFHPTAMLADLTAPGDLGRTLVGRARETGGRVYGAWSTASFEPNRRLGSGARDFDGYNSLDLAPQRSYLAAVYTGHLELADLAGVRYVISGERWRRGERQYESVAYDLSRPLVAGTAASRNADQRFAAPGRSVDAVRVIGAIEGAAALPDATPIAEVILREQGAGSSAYENPNAFPRAFLVGGAQPARPGQPTLDLMAESSFDPRRTALLEVNDAVGAAELARAGLPASGQLGRASAEIVVDEPERVVIATDSDAPAVLVLTDTSYPGWEARISDGANGTSNGASWTGRPARLWTADFEFRGVLLPPGRHVVDLAFRPFARPLWLSGLITSIVALGVVVMAAAGPARRPAQPGGLT